MVSVRLERRSGPVELVRPDGKVGRLRQPGQPDRLVALARREVRDCIAEELRRLDPDEIYAEALRRGRPRSARAARRSTVPALARCVMAAPDIAVHAQPDMLAAAAAARLLTRLVDLQAAGNVPEGRADRRRRSGSRCWSRSGPRWPGTRWTGARSSSTGATSGSCRPATRSATRPRPARRCWTTSGSTRPRCSRWAPTPAPARPARRPRPRRTPSCWPRTPGRRTTGRCRRSTSCCWAWARRGTPRRSSRTPPRCTRPSARWSPCTAAPSRRRPGCR